MSNRTAKFVSAVFASILAGTPLTTISRGETAAADNCLSGPKGETPPGSHWYYRIDHGTKRHCWYLREEGDRISQAPPENAPTSARQPAPPTETPMQRSVANAHAELFAQVNRNDAPNTDWSASAAQSNGTLRANAFGASATSTVIASRWPDPSGVNPTARLQQPVTSSSVSSVQPNPITSPAPADMTIIPAAADSSPQGERGLMPLLVAIMGAFTLACGLIAKFGRAQQPRPRKFRARQGPIWELTDDDRIVLSGDPGTHDLPRRPALSRTVGNPGRRSSRMGDAFSRSPRQAQT